MPVKRTKTRKFGQGHKLGLNRAKLVAAYYRLASVKKVAAKFKCAVSTARYHLVQAGVIVRRK